MSKFPEAQLRHLSSVPIVNGLGLAGSNDNPDWPRYIRTTDIASPTQLRTDVFASQPPDIANSAEVAHGDILMTAAGASIGKSYRFTETYPACFAGFLVRLRPHSASQGRFLGYWMQSQHYWDQINSYAVKSTIENFSAARYRRLKAPNPAEEQQCAIADYLDRETAKIDTLIEEQQNLRELLAERRYVAIANATGWGELGTHNWPLQRLSWLFETTGSGTTPPNHELLEYRSDLIPWVTTSELREKTLTATARAVSRETVKSASALSVHPAGSLLVAMYGATIGRMAILGVGAVTNQACCAFIGPTRAVPKFVLYSLLAARSHLLQAASGGGQPNINQEKLRSFRIPTPPLDAQRSIVTKLDSEVSKIDQLICETERFIELSQERRSALITAAVTGQIDVHKETQ